MPALPPSERIGGFITHLRHNGFPVGPAETMDALALLNLVHWPQVHDTRLAFKSMLCADKANWEKFDELFDAYWFGRGVKTLVLQDEAQRSRRRDTAKRPDLWDSILPPGVLPARGKLADDATGDADGQTTQNIRASTRDVLARTDLRHIVSPDDVAAVEETAEKLAKAMRDRLSRRRKPSTKGREIDIRRTIRRNLSKGGDPFFLVRRKRPERPVNLIVLLDVSGSMQQYSRLFLAFLRGLLGPWLKTDAFLFHTRLVRITDALRDRDYGRAMDRMTLVAEGFGGGTRIGHCLQVFNEQYAKECLNTRSAVIVMSDGYDTDDPMSVAKQLARLKKRARRLIWLNPLAGWDNYEPVARGMAEALPHIDLFRAANSLESLAALEPELARL
ncbi:MAG: VWA domain-containing protein [Alphaproteobacteria bacterium]|nr:VWA domain-containing protein [Alphaproteobacteria bacterium]